MRSTSEPRFTAEMTPTAMPRGKETSIAATERRKVFLNRETTSSSTGRFSAIDRPRVTVDGPLEPSRVLDVDRLIEPELVAEDLDVLWPAGGAEHDAGGIARRYSG